MSIKSEFITGAAVTFVLCATVHELIRLRRIERAAQTLAPLLVPGHDAPQWATDACVELLDALDG